MLSIRLLLFFMFFLHQYIYASDVHSNLCKKYYPHWECNNNKQLKILTTIENFIEKNSNNKGIVAFDWDGTLYHEDIRDLDDPNKTVSIKVSYRK
jgi:hypothetical protein